MFAGAANTIWSGSRAAWTGGAILGVVAFAPSLAMAQAAVGGPNKPLTIGLQETTSYDSNPSRGNSVNAALRRIQGDEVTYSPSVTVAYSRSVGLQGLALQGGFGYDYHSKNETLSREHLDFSAAANRSIGSFCSTAGDLSYSRGQSDLQTLTVDVTKNTLQTYRVSASESCATRAGLTESLSVSRSSSQNSAPTLVDYDVTGVSGMLGYSNSAIGTVGATLSYNRTVYGDAVVAVSTTPEVLGATSVGLQWSRPIGARLSGSVSVAYTRSNQQLRPGAPSSAQSSFSGLTASGGLTYTAGPRLRLSTHFGRNVSASALAGVGYSVVTNADIAADYTVSSRITASLGGSWSQTSYHGRDPLVVQTTPDRQDLESVFGRVSMQIGRRSALSADVRHDRGRANIGLYDYSSNSVRLTLSTSL